MRKGIRRYSDGDIVGYISAETANEINKLGFNTAPSPVKISKRTIDYIEKSHREIPDADVGRLKETIESPTEVLPNLSEKGKEYRAKSVLLVKRNGHNYISIVEITTESDDNVLWNYWMMNKRNARRYLEKFEKEKARILDVRRAASSSYSFPPKAGGKPEGLAGSRTENPGLKSRCQDNSNIPKSGGRRLPHIPPDHKVEGEPESLSGSQTEHLSFNKYIQNSNEKVKGFIDGKKPARKSKKGGFTL